MLRCVREIKHIHVRTSLSAKCTKFEKAGIDSWETLGVYG